MSDSSPSLLQDTQRILKSVLSTDNINKAIKAGESLKNILGTFSSVNTNPITQQLIDTLISKVQAGLSIASIAEKVRASLGTTIPTLDVTPFRENGADIRTDGQQQTIPWQLQWLYDNKLSTKDAVTMSMVTDEIVKQLVKNPGTGGGGGASLQTVNAINQAVTKMEASLRTLTGDVKTNTNTLVSHTGNFNHLNSKIQQDANDLINLTTQFNHILPTVNLIGPRPPDISNTVWEEINKLRDILGKTVVDSFNTQRDNSVFQRLNILETTGGGGGNSGGEGTTSGTVPSRTYWFKEMLLSSKNFCSVSSLAATISQYKTATSWDSSQRSLINTLYFYPPLESTEHKYKESIGINIWDNGTLRLFRGKCFVIVCLEFSATVGEGNDTNDTDMHYQLCITNANLSNESEVVIAKQTETLSRNDVHITTHTLKNTQKLHVFQFHNTEMIPAAMIRFNWYNCYPAQNSMTLNTSLMYVAPIYYNSQGKPYMNPNPSIAQELSHPILPADQLMYFGITAAQKKFLLRFMRFNLSSAEMDPQLMRMSSVNALLPERPAADGQPKPTLQTMTNDGWNNSNVVKIATRHTFHQTLQGCNLYSWWGAQLSTQGLVDSPGKVVTDRVIRLFNHGSPAGEGLFLFGLSVPAFMTFGMGNNKYALEMNALSLFGEPHLTVEVVGVYWDDYDKGHGYELADDNSILSSTIWQKNYATGDVTPFKANTDGLLTDLNFDTSKWVMKSLSKTYITIPQIAPDDITYSDPVTRMNLSNSTRDTIMDGQGAYKALADATTFDLGDFPQSDLYKFTFISVYPKFHGTTFDMVVRPNFRFTFGPGGAGIMGESIFSTEHLPTAWVQSTDHYKI